MKLIKDVLPHSNDPNTPSVPRDESEYIADDGLLHCRNCGGAREVIVKPIHREASKNRCKCQCEMKAWEESRKPNQQVINEGNRKDCFRGSKLIHCTFESSEETEELKKGRNYARHFAEFFTEGKGLLLHGDYGTGKTHIAACIANAIIDEGYKAYMTNVSELVNRMQSTFDGRQIFIDSLNSFHLLIIDDLGIERNTEYMNEQLFNIIDSRYRSGRPMIITTNLSANEIADSKNIESRRVYDRITEICHPIEIKGESRRIMKMLNDYQSIENLLEGD